MIRTCVPFLAAILLSSASVFAAEDVSFEKHIAPILEQRCVRCHRADKAKGGLSLATKKDVLRGGGTGEAIVIGKPDESLLIEVVSGPKPQMPAQGNPLSVTEIQQLKTWIAAGAAWPDDRQLQERAPSNRDWWSYQPVRRPDVPGVKDAGWPRNEIDRFVLSRLEAQGMAPSPAAGARTLIRRLYFDLVGLPPSPEEIEAFVADQEPRAFERLVDRLLASPQYGERWARHWLDIVHYGETHGYDKDKPRPNAWPYRDYVVRAFNEDKPYSQFVQEQLAGDVLFPLTRDGVEALGFIAAGPWDLIGHQEVPETKIDGKIARHLDRDDMVMNTMQTFNSLTVQCAQCHDHKFDPIPQENYYSLQAVFAAVDRTQKQYDTDSHVADKRKSLHEREQILAGRKRKLDEAVQSRAGQPLADIAQKLAALESTQMNPAAKNGAAFGYHSNIEKQQDVAKWVQVDLGKSVRIGSIVLHPSHDNFNNIGAGFGFPVRFKVEVSEDPTFKQSMVINDSTRDDVPNPKLIPVGFDAAGAAARFIRVTATKLASRQDDYIFALAEIEALTANGNNIARGAVVTALDSIEAAVRWGRVNLTDGYYPGVPTAEASPGEIARLRQERQKLLDAVTSPDERRLLAELASELSTIHAEQTRLPPQSMAYIGAVHQGTGAFAGTGANGGMPRTIHILNRGNIQQPGKEVGPAALPAILPGHFDLPPNHAEGQRRAALAQWLTAREHPLTWRSIVNRVWLYHFGKGIVETPNDFGVMGALPSHPELLDWLAIEFRDGGQSLKQLHRLIVTSATYRQSSANHPDFEKLDGENRLLWRMNRRKLEAEAVRDSLLAVSGKLDKKMGGPSFQDFVIEKPEHSPHYEYRLHDPEDPKSHRRSVYRFIVRSQQQPFMTTLDCADPSMQVGKRNESVSPLQALTMLNNAMVLTMSKHFAKKIDQYPGSLSEKLSRASYEATGRPPTTAELEALVDFARQYDLPNVCRVLFNLNEFTFVD